MGIILDPDNIFFQKSINSEIYVDKSMLIDQTNKVVNTQQQYICASRPRRFGKSMALQMLAAYYETGDSDHLFRQLKIYQSPEYRKYLNQFHVIYIDMTRFYDPETPVKDGLQNLSEWIIHEVRELYPDISYFRPDDVVNVLETVFAKIKRGFVILIDEWDCIFRQAPNDRYGQKIYLDFLRRFLKDKSYIALAYMTGILPIKKYGEHSALNMFTEISMTDAGTYAEFTGFTEQEVQNLCTQYGVSFEETKQWYDGYSIEGLSVYSPRSVVMAMLHRKFNSYWTQTETYEALKIYIQMNLDGLREKVEDLIAGAHISIEITSFQNDMTDFSCADDVLALLIHLGYLTYDCQTGTCWIPNSEVLQEFVTCIRVDGWKHIVSAIDDSMNLLQATLRGDTNQVAGMLEKVHMQNTSVIKYNDENSLACVISLAYFAAKKSYIIKRELPEVRGFADLVFMPRKNSELPPMVVELKWDQSADSAICQIKEKRYALELKDNSSEVLLVGINYDKTTKVHQCKIEYL